MLTAQQETELLKVARDTRRHAVCTYSGFAVGAALLTDQGEIIGGCNVENATYGLTVCAERVALFKALSEGKNRFVAVCVTTTASKPTPPCGACRQLLWEFGGNLEVLITNLDEVLARYRLSELFPHPFDVANLASTETKD